MEQALWQETREALGYQADWLEHSLQKTGFAKDPSLEWKAEEYDSMEALSSRFARALDYLVRKAFRLIDEFEYENQGSLLDVVHRAQKRGLVPEMPTMERMRDLRNRIAHEYAERDLSVLLREVRQLTPDLIAMLRKTASYMEDVHKG